MRKIKVIILVVKIILLITSCSTSNSVVSNKFIQKRKYNKGFHFSKKQKIKESKNIQANVSLLDSENINKVNEHTNEKTTATLIGNPINLKSTKLKTKNKTIKKPKVEVNFRKIIVKKSNKKSEKPSKKTKKRFVKPLNFSNTLNFKKINDNTTTKQSQNKIDKETYIVFIIVITLTFLIIFPEETLMILVVILFYGLIFNFFKNLFNRTLPTSEKDKKCINPGKIVNDYMDLW